MTSFDEPTIRAAWQAIVRERLGSALGRAMTAVLVLAAGCTCALAFGWSDIVGPKLREAVAWGTGMVVLLGLAAVIVDRRTAVQRVGSRIQNERDEMRSSVDRLTAEADRTSGEVETLRRELATASSDREVARSEAAAFRAEIDRRDFEARRPLSDRERLLEAVKARLVAYRDEFLVDVARPQMSNRFDNVRNRAAKFIRRTLGEGEHLRTFRHAMEQDADHPHPLTAKFPGGGLEYNCAVYARALDDIVKTAHVRELRDLLVDAGPHDAPRW